MTTDLIVPTVLPANWKVGEAGGRAVTFIGTCPETGDVMEVRLSADPPHFEPFLEVMAHELTVGAGTDTQPISVTVS